MANTIIYTSRAQSTSAKSPKQSTKRQKVTLAGESFRMPVKVLRTRMVYMSWILVWRRIGNGFPASLESQGKGGLGAVSAYSAVLYWLTLQDRRNLDKLISKRQEFFDEWYDHEYTQHQKRHPYESHQSTRIDIRSWNSQNRRVYEWVYREYERHVGWTNSLLPAMAMLEFLSMPREQQQSLCDYVDREQERRHAISVEALQAFQQIVA